MPLHFAARPRSSVHSHAHTSILAWSQRGSSAIADQSLVYTRSGSGSKFPGNNFLWPEQIPVQAACPSRLLCFWVEAEPAHCAPSLQGQLRMCSTVARRTNPTDRLLSTRSHRTWLCPYANGWTHSIMRLALSSCIVFLQPRVCLFHIRGGGPQVP